MFNPNYKNVMKTLNNTLENFANEAISASEMNFVRGGETVFFTKDPQDIVIPPKK
jgi:hypothetical protein